MYYDINKMIVEEKMEEMRKYAYNSNLYERKRKGKKLKMPKKQQPVQVLQSRKVG